MAEINETQRKKIVKVGLLETFAELVDTLYGSTMGASGQNHAPGQVPDPGATAGTSKFLCEDGTWKEPSGGSGGGNISVMGGSGSNHASGLVPDPGPTEGSSKFLREDGTWQNLPVTSSDLVTKQNKLSVVKLPAGSFTALLDTYYYITSAIGTMTITLPSITDNTSTAGFIVTFITGSSPALTINGNRKTVSYFSNYLIEASKTYELNFIYNGTKWVVAYGTIG